MNHLILRQPGLPRRIHNFHRTSQSDQACPAVMSFEVAAAGCLCFLSGAACGQEPRQRQVACRSTDALVATRSEPRNHSRHVQSTRGAAPSASVSIYCNYFIDALTMQITVLAAEIRTMFLGVYKRYFDSMGPQTVSCLSNYPHAFPGCLVLRHAGFAALNCFSEC